MRSLSGQLWNTLVPRDVIGFCYHTVSDRQLPHVREPLPVQVGGAIQARHRVS